MRKLGVQKNAEELIEREALAEKAREYLILTGQTEELDSMDMRDIRLMSQTADSFKTKDKIISKRSDKSIVKPVRTTKLSDRFDLSIPVRQSLMEIQMEEEEDDHSVLGKRARL